jgi:predicted AAA+ superfamily ATPase
MARLNFGQILENAVFNQLKHKGEVNYYQRRTGAEIDFIVDRKTAYEVKATASPTDIRHLEKGMRLIKMKKGYVVSKNYAGSLDGVLYGALI